MGLFEKLISLVKPTPAAIPMASPLPSEQPSLEPAVTLAFTEISTSAPEATDAEVATAAARYRFLLGAQPQPLPIEDRWWEEEVHKRRVQEGSETAFVWLSPFVPEEFSQRQLPEHALNAWGPLSANRISKALRAVIRERRKLKQPYKEVLKALYGSCVLEDLVESLEFEGYPPRHMAEYVSLKELQSVNLNYALMGYQCIEALGKTDIKWLVEAFGEPADHLSFNAAWPSIRQNAISRKSWEDLATENKARAYLREPIQSMEEWISGKVRTNLGYHKEWQARVAAKRASEERTADSLAKALEATLGDFVVADLETTGLSPNEHAILEFAALQVSALGIVQDELTVLVNTSQPVPSEITALTGISTQDIALDGVPIDEAFERFQKFVGNRPVFFHNAPFDLGFLNRAAKNSGMTLTNPVHDTLPLARKAWPELESYRLQTLATHVGATEPTHRALPDSKATLAVLLAARALLRN